MPTVKEPKVKSTREEPAQAPAMMLTEIQKVFENRSKALVDALDKEVNIANRYDIQTRLNELNVVFNMVMNSANK